MKKEGKRRFYLLSVILIMLSTVCGFQLSKTMVAEAKSKSFLEKQLLDEHHKQAGKMQRSKKKWSTYQTKAAEKFAVTCPVFALDYPSGWKVEKSSVDSYGENVTIQNKRGVTIELYMSNSKNGFGSSLYGEEMQYAKVKAVASSKFVPGYPDGCSTDYSSLGKFVVAKIKAYAYSSKSDNGGKHKFNGPAYFTVMPYSEAAKGKMQYGISGLFAACAFDYPSPVVIIASAPKGKFTAKEEKEVIRILRTFRIV